ncbi:MAG TPA: hypothetical protein VGC65_04235 [Bacteroidia bacterium]|jgi:hypothetical protein
MKDPELFIALSKHLSGDETPDEQTSFLIWQNKSEKNKLLLEQFRNMWEQHVNDQGPIPFLKKFTKKKIKDFVWKQAIGNLIGFIVGMSVTNLFSHYVTERRGLSNLFGLAGRKKVVVNDAPEWVQWSLSVIVGFIALEFVNHLIQNKKHVIVWSYIKKLGQTR